jgi:hypothetical protein
VAISLMMSGIIKLRIINLTGAIFFIAYGIVINAYPIAFVNGIICIVDFYYLYDIFKVKEYFKILEVDNDSDYLNYFLDFHDKEIKKYIPSFTFSPRDDKTVFFILRNSIPAGLIYTHRGSDNSLFIELDFVIPGYRDLKIGKYVYKNIFNKTQASKLFSNPGNSKHEMYLRKMGFEKTELDDNPVYCLKSE